MQVCSEPTACEEKLTGQQGPGVPSSDQQHLGGFLKQAVAVYYTTGVLTGLELQAYHHTHGKMVARGSCLWGPVLVVGREYLGCNSAALQL